MSGINQIRQRQQEWEQKRPANGGGGDNLYLKNGDIVFAHFLSSGEDDDPFMEVYYAHEIPPQAAGGFGTFKYCPVESGHDDNYACAYCAQDGFKLKKRMMIYFHVQRILHISVKDGVQLPTMDYMGRTYYVRDMNRALLWETSAWNESPLNDILFLAMSMTGPDGRTSLRQQQIILVATGDNLVRRYKIYPYQGTAPLPDELVAKAKQTVKPVIQLLRESLATPATQPNPVASVQTPTAPPVPIPPTAPPIPQPVAANPIPQPAVEYDVTPVPDPTPAPPPGGFAGIIAGLNERAAGPQKAMY